MEQREIQQMEKSSLERIIQECIEKTLKSIYQSKTKEKETSKLFTTEEASKYLNLSKATLYAYTSRKTIPFIKKGGKKIFFKKCELDQWLYE
jgi:excisionase family DNA binding protein